MRELDLDTFLHDAPAVRRGEFGGELLQLRLGCADDVAPAGLAQPCQVAGAGHAAIGDPHPAQHAVPRLHGGDDGLQGARIVRVAGKHLIAQREAIEGHHKGDADLLAVRPVIARIAALRLRIARRLAFEIGAGHVIEQHLVLHREQLAAATCQVRFQRGLVRKQVIEAAVQPVLVHLLFAELQQIA